MGTFGKRLASRYGLIAGMLLLTVGLGLFLHKAMRQKQQAHFSEHQSTFDTAYRASIQMYRLAIENFYANTIDRTEVLELLSTAVTTDGRQRDLARGRLYRQLYTAYQAVKADIPLQLQFYLPDGTSLLRFHKPDRYGDPFLESQESIRLANTEKRPVHGFETGKVRSGFRYVYPLIYQNRHLGSIAACVTAKGIRDALAELDPNREYAFLLNSDLTKPLIFPEQQWLYSPSKLHPDFLLEDANAILPESPPRLSPAAININSQLRNDPQVQSVLKQGLPLTTCTEIDGENYIVSFLPIKDVRQRIAGYLVSYSDDPSYKAFFQEFMVYLITMTIVAAIITILMLRLRRWTLALSTEEHNLQAMNQALAEGVYVTNPYGLIERINPAACKILGYSEEELLGKTAHDLFHSHSGNAYLKKEECPFFQAVSQGKNFTGEEPFRHKSGAILTVEVACRPIQDKENYLGAVTAFHDITTRKRTEEQLRKSEETSRKLSIAMEQSPTAILITDLDGTIEYVNPKLLEITGYERNELIGNTPHIFKSGLMPHGFYKKLWRQISSGETWKGEMLNQRKNGEVYWELASISPIRDHWNRTSHYIATKTDISDQKRLEDTLLENEKIQRSLMESLPVAVVIIDAETRTIERINSTGTQLFGAIEEKIIGNRCHRFLCPAHEDSCPILDMGQSVDNSDKLLIRHDGTNIPVLKTVKKITIKGRIKLLECMVDIRSRLEAEEALRKANRQWKSATAKARQLAEAAEAANRAKSTFLASMSHEIRTPLNAILGYSQLLQQDTDLQAGQREQIQTINRSGDHLLELINDILEMSRVEAGHVVIQAAPLDFRQLMADIASMFKLSCQKKALLLELALDEELPRYLAADRAKLRQVLINLLSNAVKFTHHGRIAIDASGTKRDSGAWLITVDISDTGSGIDASEQNKLFGAFEQTSSGKAAGEGTGLGLSISRAYADKMGGELHLVESEAGAGSRFRFTFKAEECPGDELQLVPNANPGQVVSIDPQFLPIRALIVEDDTNSRKMLHQTLSRAGFSVEAVESGEKAVERFKELQPEVVLMDIHLPGIDGYQTSSRLRAMPGGQQTKIIIVTASGFSSSDLAEKALEAQADDFVAKPFKASELYEKIKEMCGFRYIYAPVEENQKPGTVPTPEPALLQKLPGPLLEALRQAVEHGDMMHFSELLDEVDTVDSTLKDYLASLADRYEYEKLLDLLGKK